MLPSRSLSDSRTSPRSAPSGPPMVWWIGHAVAGVVIGAPLFAWGIPILVTGRATVRCGYWYSTTLTETPAAILGWAMLLSLPAAIAHVFLARFEHANALAYRLGNALVAAMLLVATVALLMHGLADW